MQSWKQCALPVTTRFCGVATHALEHMMYGSNIVYHVPKCMSCHKSIAVITGRAHCFHDCIYIMPCFCEI